MTTFSKTSESSVTPPRVVVLGSKGFVGAALLARTKSLNWNCLGVSSKDIDLTDAAASAQLASQVQPTDTLVFISALTPDKGRDRKTLMKNLAMADQVCSALESTPCSHLIYVSSDAVYDDSESLVRATSACNPSSFHGTMHLARERMLLEACKAKGIPVLIVRPCAVYGKGDTHNSYGPNRFLRTAQEKGEIAISGAGEEIRDHLYIDDLVSLMVLCIQHKATGVVNAASGKARSFADVVSVIQSELDKEVKVHASPRQNPVTHKQFDITAILQEFPTFQTRSLEEGMHHIIATNSKE